MQRAHALRIETRRLLVETLRALERFARERGVGFLHDLGDRAVDRSARGRRPRRVPRRVVGTLRPRRGARRNQEDHPGGHDGDRPTAHGACLRRGSDSKAFFKTLQASFVSM